MNKLYALSLMVLLFSSCRSIMDDQTLIKPSQFNVVNPKPFDRNFVKNNKQHKIIVAILDTGIDYNHPYLADNIHFDLDEDGRPTGAGWDYGGEDSWPAPYIARTDFFNPNLEPDVRNSSLEMFNYSKKFISEFPNLKNRFPIERNLENEKDETISHGTHVAGLASYDSPEIGLRGYRVIPINKISSTNLTFEDKQYVRFSKVLFKSLDKAVEDGAKVINMSLGISQNKDGTKKTKEEKEEEEKEKAFFSGFQKDLVVFAQNNPEVMIVVAAGNDGAWIDSDSKQQLPCVIPAKNVICVSALGKDMSPAYFTNILLTDEVTTIFAWGEDILSTMPTNTCYDDEFKYEKIKSQEDRVKLNKLITEKCSKDQLLKEMSGTSMASPVVARKVAKIMAKNPSLSIDEVKKELFKGSISTNIGKIPVTKLPIEMPSWYQLNDKNSNLRSINRKMWNLSLFTK